MASISQLPDHLLERIFQTLLPCSDAVACSLLLTCKAWRRICMGCRQLLPTLRLPSAKLLRVQQDGAGAEFLALLAEKSRLAQRCQVQLGLVYWSGSWGLLAGVLNALRPGAVEELVLWLPAVWEPLLYGLLANATCIPQVSC
jgi:hypothetical protein